MNWNILKWTLGRFLDLVWRPVQKQASFFCFMYILVLFTFWWNGINISGETYCAELAVDLYLICTVLTVLPQVVARWLRLLFTVLIYLVTIIDCYCVNRFGAGISPTMLQLIVETDTAEVSEFFQGYVLQWETLKFACCFLVIGALHELALLKGKIIRIRLKQMVRGSQWAAFYHRHKLEIKRAGGFMITALLLWCAWLSWPDRSERKEVFSQPNLGKLERKLDGTRRKALFTSAHRLLFSLYAHDLAAKEYDILARNVEKTMVDTCLFRSPTVIFVIGESYNKQHSQLYGYNLPTTPHQLRRHQKGEIFAFTDVITPWNMTSFAFKNFLSLHSMDEAGSWCDETLFPALFREAGYQVTLLTNQFVPEVKEDIFNFSGGFFFNKEELSSRLFDHRNTTRYPYDDGLLACYDTISRHKTEHNLVIFHFWGQHMLYHHRMPPNRRIIKSHDLDRPELGLKEKQWVANYDNATLFNDSVLEEIIRRFEKEDAILVYMPDHGEEVHDELPVFGRNLTMELSAPLARAEFRIPFLIWCSNRYRKQHPEVVAQIKAALHRPFMTDDIPHLLLYLAGIHCREYEDFRNLISPDYNDKRKRIIKGTTDFDQLMASDTVVQNSKTTNYK